MDDNKIIKIPDLEYTPDARGLGFVYYENMIKHSKKLAQIDAVTGAEDSFESLLQRSIRLAVKMRSMNINAGDIISVCSLNHLNSCVPFIAAIFLGATVVSLDPRMPQTDLEHLIKLIKPKILFAAKTSVQIIETIFKNLNLNTHIVVFGDSFANFIDDVIKDEENNFHPVEIESLDTDAVIHFSSGTTGLPKGNRLSHRSLLGRTATTIAQDNCYDRILSFSSLYWSSAVTYCSVSLITGCTRIIMTEFDINTVWATIDTYKPTYMFIQPYHSICMNKTGIPKNVNVNSLKTISIGGGLLPKNQITALKKLFSKQRVFLSYGLSETGFALYFKGGNKKDDTFIDEKPTSSGLGIFGFSYKIVDPESEKILGPNQKGELRLKSNNMLTEYFKMNSTDIWDNDGYIKTGDIGYYDDDYCFYIIDRIKEIIKYQFFQIFPSAIENVILKHPSVKIASVIGIPHKIDIEHPMALVLLNDHSNVTEDELIKFVNDRVSDRQKLRAGLKIVQNIPFTPTAKIHKAKLKQLAINNMIT